MNVLGKLFNKKKTLKATPLLKLCIIDDTSTDLWVTLGITNERRDELIDICEQAYHQFDSKSLCYEYIVDHCKHVNEVIPTTIVFDRMCEGPGSQFAGLIKLFGR
jgi:hypothetical protein